MGARAAHPARIRAPIATTSSISLFLSVMKGREEICVFMGKLLEKEAVKLDLKINFTKLLHQLILISK